jgi:DNA ligase (NAD+)
LEEKEESKQSDTIGSENPWNKIKHSTRMYSLDNSYNVEDVMKFNKRIEKFKEEFMKTRQDISLFIVEKKFDGIAVNLIYDEDGKLIQCTTRGNGVYGQDITENMKRHVSNLVLNSPFSLVRGEVIMEKDEFKKIESKYSNLRNIVSGLLLSKNEKNEGVQLKFIAYSLPLETKSQGECLKALKSHHFAMDEEFRECWDIHQVIQYIHEMEEKRREFNYQLDGVVIKVNDLEFQQFIGHTSRFPKWAIAYKFKSDTTHSILRSIDYQVSKNGRIVPIGLFDPIELNGVTIQRANLFNFNFISKMDLKIHSILHIERSGDVIPKIIGKQSHPMEEKIPLPTTCPCEQKSELKWIEDNPYCVSSSCLEISLFKFLHFSNVLGMKGVSKETMRELIQLNLLKNLKDLFQLNKDSLKNEKGWKEKRIENLLKSIQVGRRNIQWTNILNAFDIVGKETNIKIANHIPGGLEEIEKLIHIKGISSERIHKIQLEVFRNREDIKYLLNYSQSNTSPSSSPDSSGVMFE